MEVELKKEDRDLLRSSIEASEEAARMLKVAKAAEKHKHEEPKHEHFTADLEYLEKKDSCPDCVKGLNDFGKEYMRNKLEGQKDLSHECVNCGLGVDGNKSASFDWKCPNCGELNAKER